MTIGDAKKTRVIGDIVAENVSEEDYFANYEGHYEWVAGSVIKMSPIVDDNYKLQKYLSNLLDIYLTYRPIGVIREDPFTMRLKDISNRQPDIQVILNSNPSTLTKTYMDGPADICIEIVSPGTEAVDRGIKFAEYQKGGVPEYWIIDLRTKEALFYLLNDDKLYAPNKVTDDTYTTGRLPGLKFHIPTFWQESLPTIPETLKIVEAMLAD